MATEPLFKDEDKVSSPIVVSSLSEEQAYSLIEEYELRLSRAHNSGYQEWLMWGYYHSLNT